MGPHVVPDRSGSPHAGLSTRVNLHRPYALEEVRGARTRPIPLYVQASDAVISVDLLRFAPGAPEGMRARDRRRRIDSGVLQGEKEYVIQIAVASGKPMTGKTRTQLHHLTLAVNVPGCLGDHVAVRTQDLISNSSLNPSTGFFPAGGTALSFVHVDR